MNDTVKANLLEAIRFMMRPLVRLLINQGVTHAEFSEALKDVYVDSAIRHSEQGSGKVNKSQIAIKTGLTRKEVRNVVDRVLAQGEVRKRASRPERVLTGWHQDPFFQGPYGLPLDLPYDTKGEEKVPSFHQLVKQYSGDMSAKAMLEELLRGGSVIEVDGLYRVVRRDFEPTRLSRRLIERLGEVGHYVFHTAAANIEKEQQGRGHFDRYVFADDGCTDNVIEKFDEFVKVKGQLFLEDLDRWISSKDGENRKGETRKEMGVYICQYAIDPIEREDLVNLLANKGLEVEGQ